MPASHPLPIEIEREIERDGPGRYPACRFHVQSGTVRLAATAWGDPARPVVVLVHGYPDNSHVWQGVAEAPAPRTSYAITWKRSASASATPCQTWLLSG